MPSPSESTSYGFFFPSPSASAGDNPPFADIGTPLTSTPPSTFPSPSTSIPPDSMASLIPSPSESKSKLFGIPSPSVSQVEEEGVQAANSTESKIPSLSLSKSKLSKTPSPSISAVITSTNICKVAVAQTGGVAPVQAVYTISTGPLKPCAGVNT